MRRALLATFGICVVGVAIACGDSTTRTALPTTPAIPSAPNSLSGPSTCTTLAQLTSLTQTVFGPGSRNAAVALGKLTVLDQQLRSGNIADGREHARDLVSFIQQTANELPGTHAQVQTLISNILCYAWLLPNTILVYPSDQPQVVTDHTGASGVSLQANTVNVPSLLTVRPIDVNGQSPLNTKLDKYPSYVEFTISSPLTKPAIVGICPSSSIPAAVLSRLRLGHQSSVNGFEITPPANASFLNCSGIASSRMPSWLRTLASAVLPRPLYAATMATGGVGGVASEFSPFAPVDPLLNFSGPVNGSPGCPSVQAVVGTPLPPACRPVVTVMTQNGTLLQNVPVGWVVGSSGGVIAAQLLATSTCGATFASTAATATDVTGKAGVCWTLGPVPGLNTVVATPGVGGDAPLGVSFSTGSLTFTATAQP